MLSKLRSVLPLVGAKDGLAVFGDTDPDTPDADRRSATIAWADFVDMGEPSIVTVTIRPGDRLNR